jgi:hypothetical protein
VRQRLAAWWAAKPDKSARETVQTYYGPQLLHKYLERSTWHVGQHVRQWVMLLGMAGIAAAPPPGRTSPAADARSGVGRPTGARRRSALCTFPLTRLRGMERSDRPYVTEPSVNRQACQGGLIQWQDRS